MGMIGNAPYGGVIGTGNILNSAITADKLSSTAIQDKLGFIPQSANDVSTAIANLVSSAPSTLNTLDELAAALGDDANFATTIANSLGLKANTVDVNTALALKANQSTTYTKTETDSLLSGKQNSLGYTPINKAGDTFIGLNWSNTSGGDVKFQNSNIIGAAATWIPSSSSFPAGWSWYAGSTSAAIGDGSFGAWNHTTQEWAVKYDQAGRQRLPKQPVCVIGCQGADINWNTNEIINYGGTITYPSTKIIDNYNSYNFSTGRYTAPMAGNYFISATANGRYYGGGVPRARIRKNGGIIGNDIHFRGNSSLSGSPGDLDQRCMSIVLPLAAGDYIDFYVYENGFDTFSSNYFCAYMLG